MEGRTHIYKKQGMWIDSGKVTGFVEKNSNANQIIGLFDLQFLLK